MAAPAKLRAEGLSVYYGAFPALKDIHLAITEQRITALIGPSGCGKSTLLRAFDRMNDLIPGHRALGTIELDGRRLDTFDLDSLRKRVGMVFQRPNPFPLSVHDNIAFGPRIHALASGAALSALVERSLAAVGLWEALKDRLGEPALALTSEQQQRLCLARVLAVEPEVLLMDEPCSALDPIATLHIEGLMRELAQRYTIVLVTHNMQQAARVSDETGFMLLGELVEMAPTREIFTRPRDPRTDDYISGRYG
ncbi:phosphate ABC transporter ATP-binding protein [Sorangium cellulosum]|uniref:Phosphate ABC transporter ATP-binding protein n=1 Tax=Sorangium cellulosum TaxID=56 RepID=A0A150SDW6_SORCE|nr:phosphate ABC transporter ATP-binding protein [Sorangium cellulosum]